MSTYAQHSLPPAPLRRPVGYVTLPVLHSVMSLACCIWPRSHTDRAEAEPLSVWDLTASKEGSTFLSFIGVIISESSIQVESHTDRAEAECLSVWDLTYLEHPRLVTLWNDGKVHPSFYGLNSTASKLCCACIAMYAGAAVFHVRLAAVCSNKHVIMCTAQLATCCIYEINRLCHLAIIRQCDEPWVMHLAQRSQP